MGIPGLENKKVNVDVSYLDTSSNTLVISHTDSGIIESLLDTELSTEGGLQIVGWLEGPTGIISSLLENTLVTPSKTSLETCFLVVLAMFLGLFLLLWSCGGSAWCGFWCQRLSASS